MRKHFDLHPEEAFLIEIEDERGHTTFVEFRDAAEFAVIGNPYANIDESVRRVHGRFFRLTIVGEEDQNSARGIGISPVGLATKTQINFAIVGKCFKLGDRQKTNQDVASNKFRCRASP